MKKSFLQINLILLFNFCVFSHALTEQKNYFKGKFYKTIENNFLVATEKIKDNKFNKTVIVMLNNTKDGAFGLVVNKPLGFVPLGNIINKEIKTFEQKDLKIKELYDVKVPVYWGGPVDENKIFVLHSKEYKNDSTREYKNISLSGDYKVLFEIASNKGPKGSLIIMGYSGWASGQLEGEMERDWWTLSEIDVDLIFETKDSKKWPDAIKKSLTRL